MTPTRRVAVAAFVGITIAGVVASGCSSDSSGPRAGTTTKSHRGESRRSKPPVTEPAPSTVSPPVAPTGAIRAGATGSFEFAGAASLQNRPLKVWYFAPAGDLASARVLIVMHGQQRDAERYRDEWLPYARERDAILVVPEFSEDQYPGPERYNLGNLVDANGNANPHDQWSYSVIEPLFDFVRAESGTASAGYSLYGHSAGAQFVHRFMLLVPNNRVTEAVSANAGWYTLPDRQIDFPYGLKGTPATDVSLKRALGSPLVVLLGEDDTDTDSDSLRSTPEADRQGANRFDRGHYFFGLAREQATRMVSPFAWKLETVPNAAHEDAEMAPAAAPILLP